jgi:hypothetical protein
MTFLGDCCRKELAPYAKPTCDVVTEAEGYGDYLHLFETKE